MICAIKSANKCFNILSKVGGVSANYVDKWGFDAWQLS